MKIAKPYTDQEYAQLAVYCNKNQCRIQDAGDFLEAVPYNLEVELSYADKRRLEYPSLPEQLDMIYWDKINNTNVWVSTISAVKAKYPKE